MRRMGVLAGAVLLLAAIASPVGAARPWPQVTLEEACRTTGPSGEAVIRFSLSWIYVHPDPVGINIWGGATAADPGTHYTLPLSGHRLRGWTFSLPAADFDDHGYVLANVFLVGRRGGWYEIAHPPVYLDSPGACAAE